MVCACRRVWPRSSLGTVCLISRFFPLAYLSINCKFTRLIIDQKICSITLCQVNRIWWVTTTFLYFHPHSTAFSLNHPQSPAFCLMETKLPKQIFLQEEKEILVIDLSKLDQISYVWVMKFKSNFYHLAT